MGKLLLLFIVVPALELAILIQIGTYLGTLPTLALIVVTGVIGAHLARLQGLSVLTRAQEQMDRGELPAGSLADGVMILVAGALLITPGILTDLLGFALLVPKVRRVVKGYVLARVRKAVEQNRVRVHVSGFDVRGREDEGPVIDIGGIGDIGPEGLGTDADDDSEAPTPKYKVH